MRVNGANTFCGAPKRSYAKQICKHETVEEIAYKLFIMRKRTICRSYPAVVA